MSGRQKAAKRTSGRRKQQRKDVDDPPPEDTVATSTPVEAQGDDGSGPTAPPPDQPPPIVRQTRPRIVPQAQSSQSYGPYDGEGLQQDQMHSGLALPTGGQYQHQGSAGYEASATSPPVGNYYPASASGHHVPPFREMPPSPEAEQYLQEHPAITEAPPGNLDSLADGPDGPGSRPPYPYSTIIRYAIEGSPRGMLTLSEIYDVVEARFPFYKTGGAGWKNSIRHNLSLNRLFSKKARAITEPGKGAYWVINKGVEAGPKRVRKRKPRGKKARAAAEAAAAAAGGSTNVSSTGEAVRSGSVDSRDDGDDLDDDVDGNPNDEDEDEEAVDDDPEYEPGPSRRKKQRSESTGARANTGLALVASRSPPLPPTQPSYQRYPSNRYAPYPQVPAGPTPPAAAYDSRYEGHYGSTPNPFTHRGRSGVIDPGLMDRPEARSAAPSRSSAGGGEGTPPAYPNSHVDSYGQGFAPPHQVSRSQQSPYNPNSPRMQYSMPPYEADPSQAYYSGGGAPAPAPYSSRPQVPTSRSAGQADYPTPSSTSSASRQALGYDNRGAVQQPYTHPQQGYYASEHHRVPSNGTNHS